MFSKSQLIAGYEVAGFDHGSNSNGYWYKWFDKLGNVVRCTQYVIGVSINAVPVGIYLPVNMPNEYYSIAGVSNTHNVTVNHVIGAGNRAVGYCVFSGYVSATAASNVFGKQDLVFDWIKAS